MNEGGLSGPEVSLLVRAWLEPRELTDADMLFRAVLEVLGAAGGDRHGVRTLAELHHTIDAVLTEAGLLDGET